MEAARTPLVTMAATAPIQTTKGTPNLADRVAAVTWPTSPHSEKKMAAKETTAAREAGCSTLRTSRLIRLAPQDDGDREEVDRGDGRDEQRRQGGDGFAHQDGDCHLGHERHGHAEDDGSGAVARGQNAGGVQQFVPDDLGYEYGAVGGKQNRDHREELLFLGRRDAVAQQAVEFVNQSVALENIARERARTRSGCR